jgi:hypothetical protein
MATGQELNYNTGASALDMALEIFGAGTWSSTRPTRAGRNPPRSSAAATASPPVRRLRIAGSSSRRAARRTTRSPAATRTAAPARHQHQRTEQRSLLNAAAGTNTYDAAILEVDFIPTGNVMTLQFQFASEEYPEYTGSTFNDIFAIWMNGSLVTSPVFNVTQVNEINDASNPNLFQDNYRRCVQHRNGRPHRYAFGHDAGQCRGREHAQDRHRGCRRQLLRQQHPDLGGSAQTALIAQDDAITHFEGQTVTLDVLANDGTGGMMTVTHINGVEIAVNGSVVLNSGHTITLLPSGDLADRAARKPDRPDRAGGRQFLLHGRGRAGSATPPSSW